MLTDDSNDDGDYIPGKDDLNSSDSNAPPDISEPELSTPGNKESDINEIQCEKSKKKRCLKRKKKCSKPKARKAQKKLFSSNISKKLRDAKKNSQRKNC